MIGMFADPQCNSPFLGPPLGLYLPLDGSEKGLVFGSREGSQGAEVPSSRVPSPRVPEFPRGGSEGRGGGVRVRPHSYRSPGAKDV